MLPGLAPLMSQDPVRKTIILAATGPGMFQVPYDFSPWDNIIELIGGGGAGARCANSLSAGGGGGAYSKVENANLTPGASVYYNVGAGGLGLSTAVKGADGGDSWFGDASYGSSLVAAKGGIGGGSTGTGASPGGAGGQATDGIGSVKYSGGNGAPSQSPYPGAGGGAAGPRGNGNNGNNGTGGSGNAGFGGQGGQTVAAPWYASDGKSGRDYATPAGIWGSGGGGGSVNGPVNRYGTRGGLYGGGGSGARSGGTWAGGHGGDGVIVITYTGWREIPAVLTRWANDFGQYAAGSTPTDMVEKWDTANHSFTVESVAGTVSGKALRYIKTAAGRQALAWSQVPSLADGEILARARAIETPGTSGKLIAGFAMRGSGSVGAESAYVPMATYQTAGSLWARQITLLNAGTATVIGTASSLQTPNYTANTWFYMRARLFGTSLKVRYWHSDGYEPQDWMFDITDSTLAAAGFFGLVNLSDEPDAEYDYFAVDRTGATIPVPI